MVLTKSFGTTPQTFRPKIYYVGIFDYDRLIKSIAEWYFLEGYEFHEQVYKHKVPSPDGSEQEFTLKGWRKITEYVQFWINIKGHIWELKEIEAVIEGKKKKMARGKVQLVFSTEMWLDYNNKFTSPVERRIQQFLHKHVWYKKITGGWEDEVYYAMYRLHQKVKIALNMSTQTNAASVRGY